jgi:hypothetical protein
MAPLWNLRIAHHISIATQRVVATPGFSTADPLVFNNISWSLSTAQAGQPADFRP